MSNGPALLREDLWCNRNVQARIKIYLKYTFSEAHLIFSLEKMLIHFFRGQMMLHMLEATLACDKENILLAVATICLSINKNGTDPSFGKRLKM